MNVHAVQARAVALETAGLARFECDTLVLFVPLEGPAGLRRSGLDARLLKLVADAFARGDLGAGQRQLYVHRPAMLAAARLVLVAVEDLDTRRLRKALVAALGLVKREEQQHLAVAVPAAAGWGPTQAEAMVLAWAAWTELYRTTKPSAPRPRGTARLTLGVQPADLAATTAAVAQAQAIATGQALTRELANRPGNHCTPKMLADAARALARAGDLRIEVFDRKAIEKIGMGAFLAVARGSAEPPRFIVLRYQGAARSRQPHVLVGKGITFDAGGISIKPAADMDEMKFDMGGAAAVLGAFQALALLRPRINVVGLIPTCENLPSGEAFKPGDVVTSLSGQTIEVLNTDAEGRLILCDALTYARRFQPASVVDLATLTGACVIALGHVHSGLFTADETLAAALLEAGRASLDTAWRMPLDDDYDDALRSTFADMANVGPRAGGAITAAMFLRRFTRDLRWAHLDIAGTAWRSGAAKGATGRPVALLVHYLLAQVQA